MKKTNLNLILALSCIQLVFIDSNSQNTISKEASDVMAWEFKTRGSVFASPLIYEDVVYVGSLDSSFYALNAESGKEVWHFKSSNQIRSSATINNNTILFESGNTLYALNLNGKLIWTFDLFKDSIQNEIDPWDFHHSSPVIFNNTVYIGTEDGLLYGINIENGKQVFRCQTNNKEVIRTTPAISENVIYFGDWSGVLYAYNLNNGKQLWEYDTKKDAVYGWVNAIQSSPLVHNNSIYFAGRSSRLYSLNKKTGQKNWINKSPTDQWLIGGLQIDNGMIFVGSSDQYLFQAFNIENGHLKWKSKVDCRTWGTPFIYNNDIYIGSNSFYIFDKTTGTNKARLEFEKFHEDKKYGNYIDRIANIHSSPVIHGHNIIFGSDDGNIYAIDMKKINIK